MANVRFSKRKSSTEQQIYNEVVQMLDEDGDASAYRVSNLEELVELKNALKRKQENSNTLKNKQQMETPVAAVEVEAQPSGATDRALDFDFGQFNDFTGLGETPNMREYNKIESTQYEGQYIPPPQTASATETILGQIEQEQQAEQEQMEQEPKQSFFDDIKNPEMEGLSNAEKRQAAEQLADTALGVYEGLHSVAAQATKMSERKVAQMVDSGEIDAQIELTLDASGNKGNILDYVQAYNEGVEKVFEYDPEFNKKVRPALVRVLEKRDLGITDEQFLIFSFGKDIAMKGAQVISLKASSNMVIGELKKYTAAINGQSTPLKPDVISKKKRQSKDDVVDLTED
jgi:hypothetical protein